MGSAGRRWPIRGAVAGQFRTAGQPVKWAAGMSRRASRRGALWRARQGRGSPRRLPAAAQSGLGGGGERGSLHEFSPCQACGRGPVQAFQACKALNAGCKSRPCGEWLHVWLQRSNAVAQLSAEAGIHSISKQGMPWSAQGRRKSRACCPPSALPCTGCSARGTPRPSPAQSVPAGPLPSLPGP